MSNAKKVFVPFNINDEVRVKLTDYGRRVHYENWRERIRAVRTASEIPYRWPNEDGDGWSKWQLWRLMQEFGEHIHLAAKFPFEMDIQFVQYVRSEPEPQSALVG